MIDVLKVADEVVPTLNDEAQTVLGLQQVHVC